MMAKHGKTLHRGAREGRPRARVRARRGASSSSRTSRRAKFDESVEVHIRTGPERPPRRRAAARHDRAAARARQGRHDRRLRPGRQGARGRGGRRRRRRRRGPRQAGRGGLHRLRRRDRDAGHDAGRRPPRPHPRPVGQDAEPEGRHRDDGRRQGRRRSRRPARSSTAPTAPRSCTSSSARRPSTSTQLLENYAAVIDELIRAKPVCRQGPLPAHDHARRRPWAPASRSIPPAPATSSGRLRRPRRSAPRQRHRRPPARGRDCAAEKPGRGGL